MQYDPDYNLSKLMESKTDRELEEFVVTYPSDIYLGPHVRRELDKRRAKSYLTAQQDSTEVQEEIIRAMMSKGIGRTVALERTSTEAKLIEEGKNYGII